MLTGHMTVCRDVSSRESKAVGRMCARNRAMLTGRVFDHCEVFPHGYAQVAGNAVSKEKFLKSPKLESRDDGYHTIWMSHEFLRFSAGF